MKISSTRSRGAFVYWSQIFLVVALAFLPQTLFAGTPGWWKSRGVIQGRDADDFSAVNQGQVKNIAVAAILEMNDKLRDVGGAGDYLNHSVLPGLKRVTDQTSDYEAVNLGQLKALVKPFYDRLLALGYRGYPLASGKYPWIGGHADDYAMANIGQVKNLFAFELSANSFGP